MPSVAAPLIRQVFYHFEPDILAEIARIDTSRSSFSSPTAPTSRSTFSHQHRVEDTTVSRHSSSSPAHSPRRVPARTTSRHTRSDPYTMSRSSATNRPTHIPLPASPYTGRSPTGSPLQSPSSPTSPGRASFLPNFMRNRTRASTIGSRGRASPSIEASNPLSTPRATVLREISTGPAEDGGFVTRSVSTPASGSGFASVLNAVSSGPSMTPIIEPPVTPLEASDPIIPQPPPPAVDQRTYRIRLVPNLESNGSLAFDPVIREMFPITVPTGVQPSIAAASVTVSGPLINNRPPAVMLKIGRFTDKAAVNGDRRTAGGGGELTSGKVAFKSKVVSRSHAEIWCEAGGKFHIRDTSSSSGTFLNHIRLSSPNLDSTPTQLNDGDILQLGVDYQGGQEDMFRAIKIRVELGRDWQRAANEFNTNALNQLKVLGGAESTPPAESRGRTRAEGGSQVTPSKKIKASVTDCCICLFSVTVCQSLFIAPCSHVFHYKCIRPLLQQYHPGFSCPLCRTFANLEEDVETEDAWEIASRRASVISRRPSNHSIRLPHVESSQPRPSPGEPSTGIGFGDGSRSVDELLAGGESSGDAGSSDESPEPDHLTRIVTAVPPPQGVSTGAAVPEAVTEEDDLSGEIAELGNPIGADISLSNEQYFARLNGAGSLQQRLDLAEGIDPTSRRGSVQTGHAAEATVVEEGSGSRDHGMMYS